MRRSGTTQDWGEVLPALVRGDGLAVLKVTRVITSFLIRARAYDLRDSWADLCQEVLLALVSNARNGRLREPDAFVGYVAAITRNKLADWLRRNPRAGASVDERTPDPLATLRDDDLLLDLERALEELGERERKVVETIYVEGYSYEEAADRLDLPLGTLKRLQTGALRSVRARLLITRGGKAA